MSFDYLEEVDYRGYKIIVGYDANPMNPRTDYDNAGKMVMPNTRYNWGDKHNYDPGNSIDDLINTIKENEDVLIIKTISAYIHGGVKFSHGGPTDPWDSGYAGVHYITKDSWNNAIGGDFDLEKAEIILEDELSIYNTYVNNEVYCYKVINSEGKMIDNCCGFYDEEKLIDEVKSFINRSIEQQQINLHNSAYAWELV